MFQLHKALWQEGRVTYKFSDLMIGTSKLQKIAMVCFLLGKFIKTLDNKLKLGYTIPIKFAPVAQWIEQRPSKP